MQPTWIKRGCMQAYCRLWRHSAARSSSPEPDNRHSVATRRARRGGGWNASADVLACNPVSLVSCRCKTACCPGLRRCRGGSTLHAALAAAEKWRRLGAARPPCAAGRVAGNSFGWCLCPSILRIVSGTGRACAADAARRASSRGWLGGAACRRLPSPPLRCNLRQAARHHRTTSTPIDLAVPIIEPQID